MTLTRFPQLRVFWNGSLGIPHWGDDHKVTNVKVKLRPLRALQNYKDAKSLAEKMEIARRKVNV